MLIFKLPDNDKFFSVDNASGINVSFVSFDTKTILDFKGNIKEISRNDIEILNVSPKSKSPFIETAKETLESYALKISQAKDFIEKNELKKLVLSRRKLLMYLDIDAQKKLSMTKSFLKFCESYPSAFCYLFEKNGEIWMGGFSEVLGKFDKRNNSFETMSVAGTVPVEENWTDKEIEEQKAVTDYIQSILKKFSSDLKVSSTKDMISGNIKHLKTDFSAEISPESLDKIISELHPTPAVCGFPKELCAQGIKSIEHFNREFYAGYIKVETEDLIYYFVNLRCASFFKNYAFLFVGGGITLKSDPHKEWDETELKSLAIQNNLVFE
ncbi:chorismate-binding protein [Epilithonimonas caeni]|uniref:chorismate-binding protein n=1 Tax=Epilithonimonas caeni TaxID=365343 RepID=UPI0004163D60|nr:chorismate-binding protein [Epilithonimonas caeni]